MWSCFLVAPREIREWDLGEALDQARHVAKLTVKDAATCCRISEAQWYRWVSGCGPEHISFDRLTKMPGRYLGCSPAPAGRAVRARTDARGPRRARRARDAAGGEGHAEAGAEGGAGMRVRRMVGAAVVAGLLAAAVVVPDVVCCRGCKCYLMCLIVTCDNADGTTSLHLALPQVVAR